MGMYSLGLAELQKASCYLTVAMNMMEHVHVNDALLLACLMTKAFGLMDKSIPESMYQNN